MRKLCTAFSHEAHTVADTLTDTALTEMLPEPLDVIVFDVLAVYLDAAAVDVIEALQQLYDGALAAAAVTHQRRRLSVPHLQAQPVQHLPYQERFLKQSCCSLFVITPK